MRTLKLVNGHHIFVETHGAVKNQPVVLLHHGLGALRSWKGQTPVLAEAGLRVIAYDRWGHGKSDPRPTFAMPYFKEDLADLERLLDKLGVHQAALIGHSDGGKIAMYFAAASPQRVTCLVIVAAHIYIETKMQPGIEGVRSDYEQDFRFREKMRRVHGDKAKALFQGWYEGWTKPEYLAWDMRPLIHKIACPTLVVQGLEDEHATPNHARDIAAAIPNAELWLVPGAGHMLPQDCAQEFNRRVIEFIRRKTSDERRRTMDERQTTK
jgi:pimeloyl-ACP methyl ester carboxylesterase